MPDTKRRIITAADMSDPQDRARKKKRLRQERQRRRKIDGWNHNRKNQTITINSPVPVVSRTGLHSGGARVFQCPRCMGKKKHKQALPPMQGVPFKVLTKECNVCAGKGYLWI